MKSSVLGLAVALAAMAPVAAAAQAAGDPGVPPNGPANGPPSDVMRARIARARDDARAAAYDQLSAAHRARVQSIVDQINSGKLGDLRDAANQIDAILTPAETKAVLALGIKLRDAMRRPVAYGGGGPDGPPPGGPPPDAAPPGPSAPPGVLMRAPDAGRFLLLLGVNDDRMRALLQARFDAPPSPQ